MLSVANMLIILSVVALTNLLAFVLGIVQGKGKLSTVGLIVLAALSLTLQLAIPALYNIIVLG